ncbi:trifunctional nucleotide phosphoesterase protein YfkN isoform X2 [Planococcus citri]|uniref:trifunctional nucleotide phosphoesterase protein YfkN isoform X2 n=1 Tax=Planococcus citri TaxID=170843 RepID=UPI0031FA1592
MYSKRLTVCFIHLSFTEIAKVQITLIVTDVLPLLFTNFFASLEVKHAASGISKMSTSASTCSSITILHFNDVYNVEPREADPAGGASKFSHAVKSFSSLNPLVLFSGDIFSPSLLSTFTKGEQMSQILNEVGTHCAVFGNHDFDFGLETLAERVSETNFPWLMSNVIDNETGRPLGDGKITHVIEWNGKRIGLIGLVEEEWIDTLATINADELTFMDFVDVAQKLSAQLKEEGCDYVIALTHMRTRNDKKLAEHTTDVDLILGGHDHVYDVMKINDKYIIKSGTDFRQFSKITIDFENSCSVNVEEINVLKSTPDDPAVVQLLDKYKGTIMCKMTEVLGTFHVDLEGRFCKIRTEETNLGNWMCDILLAATGADLVILNSGTFRSDQIHPAGEFTLGDLMRILPKAEATVELNVTGEIIWKALENAVSKYPELEGRFPQVAGVKFAFDPNAPPGQRVDPLLVRVGDEYLVMDQNYKLATKNYLHSGCDGYTMLQHCDELISQEICPELCLSIQNHFSAIRMRQGKSKRLSKHRQSLVTLSRRHSLVKQLEGSELDGPSPLRRIPNSPTEHHHQHHHHHGQVPLPRVNRRASLDDLEQESCLLAPTIENRIVKLTPEIKKELYLERERILADSSVIPEVEENEIQSSSSSEELDK